MSGYVLRDDEREALIQPCHRFVGHLGAQRDVMGADIEDAWVKWKLRQSDANGLVKVVSAGSDQGKNPRTEVLVRVEDVEPWQCSGPLVENPIDLAFKLWIDEDPDFASVLEKHGINEVFALVGIAFDHISGVGSLIHLNQFLVTALLAEIIDYWQNAKAEAAKQSANLAKGRETARNERIRRGDERRHLVRKAAFDYWSTNPHSDRRDAITYLQKNGFNYLAESTIARLIAGVHGEVVRLLRSAKTDLYATTQGTGRR